MVIELTKASKEEIMNHIAEQAGKRALKVAICVAIALFVFFFFINKMPSYWGMPHLVFRIAAIFVPSMLAAFFTYTITGNKQLDKHGLKSKEGSSNDSDNSAFVYTSSFESSHPSINPASGLPMHGGIDSAGNFYGSHR